MTPRRRPARPAAVGLNPQLHGRLRSRVGAVQVGCEGEAAAFGAPRIDPAGRPRSTVEGGETYSVCCPFCADSRFRLRVHHLWCTPDPLTGEPMRHLAHCHNEDCLRRHYGEFESTVFDEENAGRRRAREEAMRLMRVRPGIAPDLAATPELPGACVPLDELGPAHPAVAYLRSRGFDPLRLARDRDVACCVAAEEKHRAVRGRIVVPVTDHHARVGWQARYPADLDWKAAGVPKYYTMPGFKAGRHLYGADLAERASPRLVVVVEGITDAWSIGPQAVACFGKNVTQAHRDRLRPWALRGGLCLLCLDPGAWTDEVAPGARERAAARRLRLLEDLAGGFAGRFAEVRLPEGQDPGSLGPAAMHEILRDAAAAAGFDLSEYQEAAGRPAAAR